MNGTATGAVLIALVLVCTQALAEKPDWQSMDAPSDPAAIVTVPEFPEVNRSFTIQRGRGDGTVMRVADANGRLEILDGDKVVTSIRLGRCFSFSRMNAQHDFGAQGSPQYATAPPDCRVWNSRRWTQTYKTQTTYYRNPCVYAPEFVASIDTRNGTRLVHTVGTGRGQILDNGKTFSINTDVTFDESLGFFRMFDVGYIGRIDVLNEIK